MYRAFFRFREQPFNLTPDPKFLYLNATYREALAALRYGITERKGFVSLIGEAGTGKTTLLRTLLGDLPAGTRSVLVLNPAIGFDELLAFILTDLGQPARPGTPKLALLQVLNQELLDTLARGGNVVVLIDEAQDLAIPVLEELRLLSNIETAKEKILQFVLAGQPELASMLARPELRQLRQRIAVPARLRPLRRPEVAAYVAARLRAAGGDTRLFTRPALYRLWRFSRGVPRLLNVACDNALVSAYAGGAERVGWRIVGEAVRDLRQTEAATHWRRRLATVVAAAVVGSILGVGASRLLGASFSRSVAALPAARSPRQEAIGMRARAEDVGQELPQSAAPAASDGAPIADASAAGVEENVASASSAQARQVRVEAGDTLTEIAHRYYGYEGPSVLASIKRANPGLTDLDVIGVGQTIVLPADPSGHEPTREPASPPGALAE